MVRVTVRVFTAYKFLDLPFSTNISHRCLRKPLFILPAHGGRFWTYVHFSWLAWGSRGILKSGTSVLCDMRRTSDTFSCCLHVIKTLAGVVDMRRFLVAGVVFGELGHVLKGSKVLFCEAVVIFDLAHDDHVPWQAWCFRDLDKKDARSLGKTW